MIVKFEDDNMCSFHECIKINVNKKIMDFEILNGFYMYGLEGVTSFKTVTLTRKDGQIDDVAYGKDAILMNNEGETICSI